MTIPMDDNLLVAASDLALRQGRTPVLAGVTPGPNNLLTRAIRFGELRLGDESLRGPVLLVGPLQLKSIRPSKLFRRRSMASTHETLPRLWFMMLSH